MCRGFATLGQVSVILVLHVCGLYVLPGTSNAEWVSRSIEVGGLPRALAINPVTNKIYVAQEDSARVFVFEPLTGIAKRIDVGNTPDAVAVNPITNRIYVANQQSASVSVLDGTSDAVITTIPVGSNPYALAVNVATNKVYVANRLSNSVSVINGLTNMVETTVPVGTNPQSLAVNPLTNKIYVANRGSSNVTPIDGSTGIAASPIVVGSSPNAIAVNPTTNFIYVANQGSGNVTKINGVNHAKTTIIAGSNPYAVAVNPITNTIYVANVFGNSVTIINGATNGTTTVPAGTNPLAFAVNPTTNRVYVANLGGTNLTIIDAANVASSLTIGSGGLSAGVNCWTGKVYIARNNSTGLNLIEVDATINATSMHLAGPGQSEVAVNRKTHRAYVVSADNDFVAEFDLLNLTSGSVIGVGDHPTGIVVDEIRDRIYVANLDDGTVSTIDGPSRSVTTVPVGVAPRALALDVRGNQVFVANFGGGVTIIDGSDFSTQTVTAGAGPWAVAYDPVAGECYVANRLDNSITRIHGDLTTTHLAVGEFPSALAIEPATHRIFVAYERGAAVGVIAGLTFKIECTLPFIGVPASFAVDPVRRQVFVADSSGTTVMAIKEDGWIRKTITTSAKPFALAVNQWSGRLYVGCLDSPIMTVVDLNSLESTPLSLPNEAIGVAVDDQLGRAIAAQRFGGQAGVITESPLPSLPLTTSITPLAGHEAAANQDVSGTATSIRSPSNAAVAGVFLVLDSPAQPWLTTAITSGTGTPSVSWQLLGLDTGHSGLHQVWAAALDQTSSTLDNSSNSASSVFLGQPAPYLFTTFRPFTRPLLPPPLIINVEVDWFEADDHDHKPNLCELEAVQSAFYRNGIYLHFELGNSIPETPEWEVLDMSAGTNPFDLPGEWTDLEMANRYPNHAPGTGWHYMVFCHRFLRGGSGSSGAGETPGDEFLVSMGAFSGSVGTPWDRAGSFMHELGHNLELDHAGPPGLQSVQGEEKPNYLSVMCYRYQLRGVKTGLECLGFAPAAAGVEELDFSHGCAYRLNENALIESEGMGYGGVDWDCSGGIGGIVSRDVSGPDDYCNDGPQRSLITDYNDWANIHDITSSAAELSKTTRVATCGAKPELDAMGFSCNQPDPCQYVIGVPEVPLVPPSAFLGVPFPNPFSERTHIAFSVLKQERLELTIFNLRGQPVANLFNEIVSPGRYVVTWNGQNELGESAPGGIYFGRLVAGDAVSSQKILRLR